MSHKRLRNTDPSQTSQASQDSATDLAAALADRREKSQAIRTAVTQQVDKADPEVMLSDLYNKWDMGSRGASLDDFMRTALVNFGLPDGGDIDLNLPQEFGLRQLDEKIETQEVQAIALFNRIRMHDPGAEHPELHVKAQKIIEMVYYAKRVVLSAFQARLAVHDLHSNQHKLADDLDTLLGSWTLRFRWIDPAKSTPLQKLLLHLLDSAMEKRYRKHNGYVYEPIVVAGFETHAWRQVCEIKEFVYDSTPKELHWEVWSNLTASGSNAKMAIEHLSNCNDYQFPFLHKDRSVFSFRNGVYIAREDHFHRFGSAAEPLSDSLVSARFFDAEFEEFAGTDWRDIPTPNLQKIMDYQEWPADVCDWLYVALGRLLYDVGDRDGWQVIPFLLGSASSGKSTVSLKVAKLFYEHADVGVLSNNIERQFGLSAFWDKLLFVGPEIKGDLRVEQAEFQSIVSGESVQVSAKHKKAFTVEWSTPGILAGNEVPAFSDNAGSIQRRFLVFSFKKAVINGDMKLADKLACEMPRILVKSNRAYLDAATRWGSRNVWTVLPAYFHDTRNEMAQAVNSVEAFLVSQDVMLDSTLFCPYKEFRTAWKAFAITNGYKIPTGNSDQPFTTPFDKFGLRIEGLRQGEYRGVMKRDRWVVGLDLAESGNEALALG